jgi:hypothetical protein
MQMLVMALQLVDKGIISEQTFRDRFLHIAVPSDEQKRAFFARRKSRGGNCPAVIFLNKERTQIGCAAHPQANDGADYRELVEHCVPEFFCTKGKQFMKGGGRAVAQILKEAEEHKDNPIARSLCMGEEVKTVA